MLCSFATHFIHFLKDFTSLSNFLKTVKKLLQWTKRGGVCVACLWNPTCFICRVWRVKCPCASNAVSRTRSSAWRAVRCLKKNSNSLHCQTIRRNRPGAPCGVPNRCFLQMRCITSTAIAPPCLWSPTLATRNAPVSTTSIGVDGVAGRTTRSGCSRWSDGVACAAIACRRWSHST